MFAGSDVDFGGDLVARNIQRGRDHGIPGFCCYYNLIVDSSFDCDSGWDKRYDDISQENWELLRTIYDKPSDIDIFTGGLAQEPFNGGLTGEVFQQLKCKFIILLNPNQAGLFGQSTGRGVGVESARSNFDSLPLRPGWRQDGQTFM